MDDVNLIVVSDGAAADETPYTPMMQRFDSVLFTCLVISLTAVILYGVVIMYLMVEAR